MNPEGLGEFGFFLLFEGWPHFLSIKFGKKISIEIHFLFEFETIK
jgi:hypothetical protein